MHSLVSRLRRRLNFPSSRAPLILLYHRVAAPSTDPFLLSVSPTHFEQHVEVIRRQWRPTPLREFATSRPAPRSIAITFDDGYVDNLHTAAPILTRQNVPATVFIATAYLDQPAYWWDTLETILLHPNILPSKLHLDIPGRPYDFALEGVATYAVAEFTRHAQWNLLHSRRKTAATDGTLNASSTTDLAFPTPRHAAFAELHPLLKPLPHDLRQPILDSIRPSPCAAPTGRPMTTAELHTLAKNPLIDIGAHTHTHPQLSALSPDAQSTELAQSKSTLESLLGRPVPHLAYPFGGPADFTPATIAAARAAGFTLACATTPTPLPPNPDRYALPRITVPNVDGDTFAKLLMQWSRMVVE